MAIIKRGILGGFSNKIGNVVGTSWKGISVMRSLPQSVHNPKTEPQTRQRVKFRNASTLGSAFLDTVIKRFWDPKAVRMSGYNLFVSTILKEQEDNLLLNFEDVKLLSGCPISVYDSSVVDNEGDIVSLGMQVKTCGDFVTDGADVHAAVVDQNGNMLAYSVQDWVDAVTMEVSCIPPNAGHLWTMYVWGVNESDGSTTSSAAKTFDVA